MAILRTKNSNTYNIRGYGEYNGILSFYVNDDLGISDLVSLLSEDEMSTITIEPERLEPVAYSGYIHLIAAIDHRNRGEGVLLEFSNSEDWS